MSYTKPEPRKKSAQAIRNEGNDLFFRILKNILTYKSDELFEEHVNDPTFDDVYMNVSAEKALSKCLDGRVVRWMADMQCSWSRIADKKQHYWYLLKSLPKTEMYIDWKG